MNHVIQAIRLLQRDLRTGELTLLIFALVVAVTATTSVGMLGDRLKHTMEYRSAEYMGGDLSISSPRPLSVEWNAWAEHHGLKTSNTVEFSSVIVEADELLLVSIKAVHAGYPLRGEYRVGDLVDDKGHMTHEVPNPGEMWVESSVLDSLKVKVGDRLTLGEQALKVTKVILYEPDKRGDFFSLSPRVLVNEADLQSANVLLPGSRVRYFLLCAGDREALKLYKDWLNPQLQPGQRVNDIHDHRPELGATIKRAEQFLGMTGVGVVLIAGVAIALSARRYSERHYDLVGVLKALGLQGHEVIGLFMAQLFLLGVFSSMVGAAIGWALQSLMVFMVADLLPTGLLPPGPYAWLLGLATGLTTLFGFALPPILSMTRLSPLRVLRRDLAPPPLSAWLVYGVALLTVTILLWRYTQNIQTLFIVLGGTLLGVTFFCLLSLCLLVISRGLSVIPNLGFRLGLKHLTRRPMLGIVQLAAFAITLVTMQVIFIARTELISQWQQHLPHDAPNQFVLNLMDADVDRFNHVLEAEDIHRSELYPVVRGRLIKRNGEDLKGLIERDRQLDNALNRELSLTMSLELPSDNRVLEGQWLAEGVSVEKKLADGLGLHVGDQLSFLIGGQVLETKVTSTRSVQWDNMTPNFYMIFTSDQLSAFPRTWLTSFHLSPEQKAVLPRLIKAFPGLTLLDVDKLLQQFQNILNEVTMAIQFLLILALLLGVIVLLASVSSTMDERIHEDTILRALGASERLLKSSQWTEFFMLGLLAGVLSCIVAESLLWILYQRVFELSPRIHVEFWLLTPISSAFVIGSMAVIKVRTVTKVAPMALLRGM